MERFLFRSILEDRIERLSRNVLGTFSTLSILLYATCSSGVFGMLWIFVQKIESFLSASGTTVITALSNMSSLISDRSCLSFYMQLVLREYLVCSGSLSRKLNLSCPLQAQQ